MNGADLIVMNGAGLLEGPGMAIAIGAAFLLLALIVLLRHKAAPLRHQSFPPSPFA
jgi:hypothetical protein